MTTDYALCGKTFIDTYEWKLIGKDRDKQIDINNYIHALYNRY